MKHLLNAWKNFKTLLKTDTDIGENKEHKIAMVIRISFALMTVALAMGLVNLYLKAYVMFYGSIFLALGMAQCILDCERHKRTRLAVEVFFWTSTPAFTYFFIIGGNDGFATLWIAAIPLMFVIAHDLKVGLRSGIYFLILVCSFCWIPALRNLIQYNYGESFFIRFPFLYISMFAMTILIGVQMKKHEIEQMNAMNKLNSAVNEERNRNLKLFIKTIATINNTVEAKDEYTGEHSHRVALYAKMIAERLGWDEDRQIKAFYAGLVHDIGKISIPDGIIRKPGKLDSTEYNRVKEHTTSGYKILEEFDFMDGLSDGVLYHHERYDGTGYPHQLSGEAIPEIARIIGVADAFDAMYSTRAYRERMTMEAVISELEAGKGTQFDPRCVEAMIQLLNDGAIS